MATAKKPAKTARKPLVPAPAPRGRAQPVDAPAPDGMAKKAVDTEGNVQDISGGTAGAPNIGIDPRTVDGSVHEDATNIPGGGYTDANGHLHAAPPTPTRESAATANDAPGAGGSLGAPAPRRTLLEGADVETVKVKVLQAFRLTDAAGGEHAYDAATDEMPRDHAEHWYAKANGVKIVK